MRRSPVLPSILAAVVLTACAGSGPPKADIERGEDRRHADLLTAGLGLDGLRQPPRLPEDGTAPTPAELRRLAVHSNYAGLIDRSSGAGLEALPAIPGVERHGWVRLPGRRHPARLMVQVPDALDTARPCLVVSASSGSRGIYGALPVGGPWALPRGCAFATTDKGAGTDLFDHPSDTGVTLDGTRAARGEAALGFAPPALDRLRVSLPHAHSGDHPEADWGRYTIEAARFGLETLEALWSGPEPMPEVRVIAVGLSNGGGAVLRALEQAPTGLFDAAVVAAPNVTPPGARPLFDYATEAALFQPCLLADPQALAGLPLANPMLVGPARARCESLAAAGLIDEPTPAAARAVLEAGGFDEHALTQVAVNVTLDVWRSVAALYASSYLRSSVDAMPCGYTSGVRGPEGATVAAGAVARNLWWATSSGVVPGGGVEWVQPVDGESSDPHFERLACLRALWTGDGPDARALRRAVEATRATAELPAIPIVVLHGRRDGLIPAAFSARPYIEAARTAGADELEYREIENAQHFDSLVAFPGLAGTYVPLLPLTWAAMDEVAARLDRQETAGR
ncbi:hydrogenase [Wenzhouxiangella sp. XN79A]|uniref:3-hydroxybutyrate oligomer hydrolase family protein n=1 Tax=Wenzhouxiangella sp. XN79A TaxID=2724193 RepID=UPI00144AA5E8|nr:3-hydroxybutyrate oligomer hydrolase family protein [Wenzhouxiangella sp. XN79A]NKI36105.1 hydrogenase [Wenzhouxiangella sp. XN79A]